MRPQYMVLSASTQEAPPPDTNQRPDTGEATAATAQTRVDDARERERAARAAAEQATTGSARRAHDRVADLHAALALSHDDHAKALRLRRTGAGA
jgi:hypothetical protein